MFTDDAHIDYSSAGAIVGSRDEVVDWFAANFGVIPWSMHYITNIESEITGDTATVRAMFYNPMQLPGMAEMSSCGGYYHHELVRTADGWRSRRLREENVWFANRPTIRELQRRGDTSTTIADVSVSTRGGSAFGGQLTTGGGDFTAASVAHRA